MVDGLDRDRLLRRGLRRSTASSAARRSASIVCPIGQFNFVQSLGLAAGSQGSRRRRLSFMPDARTASAATTTFPAASWNCTSLARRATWTARSASIASTPARTTTSASLPSLPGDDLWNDAHHSGIGRLGERPDLAALIVLLVFGAFANAAGMVAPVVDWQSRSGHLLGQRSPLLVTSLFYVTALIVLPLLMVGAAAVLSRRWGGLR